MPFLKEIVSIINETLQVKAFTDKRFANAKLQGIAVSIQRTQGSVTETLPVLTNDFDNETYVGIDDQHPLICYHKTQNIQRKLDLTQSFGADKRWVETTSMQMVVYADRLKIRLTPEELDSLILAAFPAQLTGAQLMPYKIKKVRFISSSSNFNSAMLYASEYKSGEYKLKPNSIFFAINYQVEMQFNQSCLEVCTSCSS